MLSDMARGLAAAGAEGLLLCANTIHKYADAIHEASGLPIIHIADVTAEEITKAGFDKVGLLGTRTTMNEPFYKEKLRSHGITAIVPDEDDRNFLNDIIFNELAKDIFRDETRQEILRIMKSLAEMGAQGIILGCTEIPLIIKPEHTTIPLFDTLLIHSKAAASFITG
jgi:aspartate racemase